MTRIDKNKRMSSVYNGEKIDEAVIKDPAGFADMDALDETDRAIAQMIRELPDL